MPQMPPQGDLGTKPLEFNDFSGGVTENIIQGDPRRYEKGDNFFITVDHKLLERPGFLPDGLTSYKIVGFEGQRINNYHLVHNDDVRIPQVSRSLFTLESGDWAEIVGVAGNQALSGGTSQNQTTTAEFQRVVYMATDVDLGCLPSKVFIDENGDWTAMTAGLPRAFVNGNYTDATLLAKCIGNANALRAAMILHFLDSQHSTFIIPAVNQVALNNLHWNPDTFALCYFQSVSFGLFDPRPNPLPTPLGPCTDQASMFALVEAINIVHAHHVGDAMLNSWGTQIGPATITPTAKPNYHSDNPTYLYSFSAFDFPFQRTKGPGPALQATGTPTTLAEAASMLDDVLQKWNWHRLSVNVHDVQNNFPDFNKYAPLCTAIGDVFEGNQNFSTITPDWSDIIGFANNLKYLYNGHVMNQPAGFGLGGHKMADNFIYNQGFQCTLPDATDLNSAFLLIYWLRSLYQMHFYDASFIVPQFIDITFTTTANSPILSTVISTDFGTALGAGFVGQFVETNGSLLNATLNKFNGQGVYTTARVIASSSGSLTLDSTAIAGATLQTGQVAIPMYHHNYSNVGAFQTNTSTVPTTAAEQLANSVSTVGTDIPSWMLLAQDFFFAFSSHINNNLLHMSGSGSNYQNRLLTVPNIPFYLPASEEVAYALVFTHSYTVEPNGIQYLVRSNPIFSASTLIATSYPVGSVPVNIYPTLFNAQPIVTTHGNLLTDLPVVENDATTNYDTANINLEIYRTTDGGQNFFLIGTVPNGTTQFLDMVNDSLEGIDGSLSVDEGKPLYTTGGVVGDDQPPPCKFTHMLGGYVYYGAIFDTGQFFPNRMRQSKPNAPDSAPASFFDDFDSPLVGITSARNNLIALCRTSVYRCSNQFNTQGNGSMIHENISDTLGCLNSKSIVQTEIGVFFAGTDGFYYTDGYQIINITFELKDTYAKYTATDTQKKGIYGAYDKINRRIWWSLRTGQYDSDASVVWVFYVNYGVKPSGVFTTISNGLNFRPSSFVIQNGVPYYAHEKGFLLKLDPWNKWDAIIDPSTTADQWDHGLIPYWYRSVAVDLGTTFQRKWITKMHLVGKNEGNMGIQANSIRDLNQYDQGAVPLAPINYTQNFTWGDPTFVWGNPDCVWKTDGKMDVWRRMPAGQLRSDFMQIEFKPAYLPVYASSVNFPPFAFVQVVASGGGNKTVQILTPSGFQAIVWPLDVVGYDLTLDFDEYTTTFPIIGIPTANEILVEDPSNILPVNSNNYEWEIVGVKKEQRVHISSYVLHYAYLGDENQSYPGSTSSSGAGNAGGNP